MLYLQQGTVWSHQCLSPYERLCMLLSDWCVLPRLKQTTHFLSAARSLICWLPEFAHHMSFLWAHIVSYVSIIKGSTTSHGHTSTVVCSSREEKVLDCAHSEIHSFSRPVGWSLWLLFTVLITGVCIGSSIDVNGPLRFDHHVVECSAADTREINVTPVYSALLSGFICLFQASLSRVSNFHLSPVASASLSFRSRRDHWTGTDTRSQSHCLLFFSLESQLNVHKKMQNDN